MKKKLLIVSLFATLMLLVPMTSVIGVSDVENDCGCQVVNRNDLFRVKLLLVKIKVFTNMLLLRFGYIPEIREKCQEILDLINSNKQLDNSTICDMFEPIWYKIEDICDILGDLQEKYWDYPIIYNIIGCLAYPIIYIIGFLLAIRVIFDCEWGDIFPPLP